MRRQDLLFLLLWLMELGRAQQIPPPRTQPQQCVFEVPEDVCPQREGFDSDCEKRCLTDHPLRTSSGCFLRNHGTLLSFFGIRSFVCRCELPAAFCDPRLAGQDLLARAFSLPAIQEHSALRRLQDETACNPAVSLTCIDGFSPNECAWGRPSGRWFSATPKTQQLPFAPSETPTGVYLIGGSPGKAADAKLTLETCDGLCSKGDVKLSARIWRRPSVDAELCFRDGASLLCTPIKAANGRPIHEVLPQTDRFAVMLRFANLSAADHVFVDDLRLEFAGCDPPRLTRTEIHMPKLRREPPREVVVAVPDAAAPSCAGDGCGLILDRTCLGRAASLKCAAKCRELDGHGRHARCLPQKEHPFSRRCVCEPRRSPESRLFSANQEEADETEQPERHQAAFGATSQVFGDNAVDDLEEPIETQLPVRLMTAEEVCSEHGLQGCEQFCAANPDNGTAICAGYPRPVCRCAVCSHAMCDFEKGKVCGWTDLHTISRQFNNMSIASKKDNDNRYGITKMEPNSYSGLVRKGWLDGPIVLSVDVFPSDELQVRICVDSLSRCQNQNVSGRAWNRVTAKIRVTKTNKIFLLFNNNKSYPKTVAVDNVAIDSGPCSKRHFRRLL